MHWADVAAEELERLGSKHVVATGITPSGHIHLGNMREILSGDILSRAARDRGLDAKFIYLADTFDPLRKIYPFLDESYAEHVGKPLSEIPCPCGGHGSYADHFLEPFLEALEELGIEHETLYVHQLYADGRYADTIKMAMDGREKIKAILSELSGRELEENWWPYSIKCSQCGKIGKARITGYAWPHVEYLCSCGNNGKADLRKDDGKLPWRVDWPARWHHLGVTCEPFGKDHATRGGSYDTGARIIEEVFGGKAPHPVVYEWIQLKGKGAMASSTGVVVKAVDMLGMTPPEVMRFLIARYQPNRHIDFDPGLGILNLVDEYDRFERLALGAEEPSPAEQDKLEDIKRVYALSQPGKIPEKPPLPIPYRHFVSLVQIAKTWDGVLEIIIRTEAKDGLGPEEEKHLRLRDQAVRFWLENFAPEDVKFSICHDPPDVELAEAEKNALLSLKKNLAVSEWEPGAIHNAIHGSAEEHGLKANELFRVLYLMTIGKKRGPRLGFFFSLQEREWVLGRLAHYVG
ncbi:MAG: lysine--tRNA ligase [Candidatus Thermoplasmatota archaeon]|nr:lysine--tRNA ligase [Candidatus Thermoplasmatota archaeon]